MRFTSAIALALSLPFTTLAAPIRRQISETDLLVLKFAHVLEQLETEFYRQALARFQDNDFIAAGFGVPDVPKQVFASILAHEDAHTSFLGGALGAQALSTCVFNFDSVLTDVATMATVARLVEQVGVGAYLGGANLLSDPSLLLAAAGILTIEARHQSALNILNGGQSVPQAFDLALSPQQVLALASPFISGCDLGIPANLPVVVANTPVPGQRVAFDLSNLAQLGVNAQTPLFCQMLLAGQPFGLVQHIQDCIVPTQLPDGPVFLFITSDAHPLAASIINQNAQAIVSGPAILFIDQVQDALSDLAISAQLAQQLVGGQQQFVGGVNGLVNGGVHGVNFNGVNGVVNNGLVNGVNGVNGVNVVNGVNGLNRGDINVVGVANAGVNGINGLNRDVNVVGLASSNIAAPAQAADINVVGHVFIPA